MPIRHIDSIIAICWLWLVQPIAAQTVPELIQRLQNEGPEARRQAINDLAEIGPKAEPAIPRLAKLLEDDHNDTAALDALVSIGVASVPALTDVLANSKNGNARHWAAVALGEIAPKAKEASIPALTAALSDPDWSVRSYSAKSLANFGAEAKPALMALINVLNNDDDEARQDAALALGHIGPDAKPARDALTKALGDKTYIVQLHAAWALERIGPEAKSIPGLVGIIRNGHPFAYRHAIEALMRIGAEGEDAIVKDVVPLLVDKVQDPFSQGFAWGYLTTLGPKAKAAVPALRKTLKELEWLGGKIDVIGALGAIGPDARDAVPDLIELVKKDLTGLDSVERERWIEIRYESISALGRIGPGAKAAIPILLELMKQDDSPLLRRRATDAIRLIDAATKP